MPYMEQRAQQLLIEADKKLHTKNFFHLLFGMKNKTEEAINCYEKAGHLFKLSKNWSQAAEAYRRAAKLNIENYDKYNAANNFILASKCFMKYDYKNAIDSLLNSIEIYYDMGKFYMVAKQHQQIAEIYETNFINYENAIQHYNEATEYYKFDENSNSARKCLMKVAQYSAELENYEGAIAIYEQLALEDLKNDVLRYGAKKQFFRAALCHLCVDLLNSKHALNYYLNQYPSFEDCREFTLIQTIIQSIEDGNLDLFQKSVTEFDSLSELDPWHTKMLLRIKNKIKEFPDLL